MILFLDTVSYLPEFTLILDNKIIYSLNIVKNKDEKMSDHIIPAYLLMDKKFNLDKNLQYLLINTGPGSYTALRVGISFFAGLSLSKKINLKGISCVDLFNYEIKVNDLNSTAIYISSSNNQNFLCFYDNKKNSYNIKKLETNINKLNFDKSLKKIITNCNKLNEIFENVQNIEYKKMSFKEIVKKNIKKILSSSNEGLVQPIYISNNKILN